jgi:hypothetical protein
LQENKNAVLIQDCDWEEADDSITPQQRRYDLKKASKRRMRESRSINKV